MKKDKMKYIAIVDDKQSIRNALSDKINASENYKVLFTCDNGKDFLEKMKEARKNVEPDVVLMDIDMPVMDGIEAVSEGKLRFPNTKYLMLTIFDEDDKIFNAIKAGADGYLLKDESVEKIKQAILDLINEEGAPMSPSIARKALRLLKEGIKSFPEDNKENFHTDYKLTEKEEQVLVLLVDGLEYKEIGQKLSVSPNTVRNHISKIYKKLHVTSRAHAVKVYMNNK